jgi:hypothetical protein
MLTPPADSTPPDALRRARNVGPLLDGRLTVAPPYKLLENPGLTFAIHSITRFGGRLFAIVGANLRRNAPGWATVTLPAAFNPAGAENHNAIALTNNPVRFIKAPPTSDVLEYLFVVDQGGVADGLFKVAPDGTASRWGIHPLTETDMGAAAAAPGTQSETFIHTAASDPLDAAGNWTLATADETALSGDTAISTAATPAVSGSSIKFAIGKDDAAQITRNYAPTTIDLTEFGGGGAASSVQDYIQFWVLVRRPTRIETVEIAFDTSSAGDFKNTFFSRALTFKVVTRKKKRELLALGDLVKVGKEQEFLQENADNPTDLTFDAQLGAQKISIAKNTWTRITLPKASFEKVGAADWATVTATRFTVTANKEGKTAIYLDRLTMNGGTGMVGQYLYAFTPRNSATGTRSNPVIDDDGVIVNVPVLSGTEQAVLERQPANVQFDALAFDPQADELEVWRTMGNGQTYFKAGYIDLTTPGTAVATVIVDRTSDYIGLHDIQDAEYTQAVASGTFHGFAVLDGNETLPLDNDTPNADDFLFRDAVGLHHGRMWYFNNIAATGGAGNGYYSPTGRAEAVSAFIQITSGDSDTALKGQIWDNRLFVISLEGLYEIMGTDEPFVARKIESAPGTLLPNTFVASSLGLFWVAPDGVYYFDGTSATNLTDQTLAPIFRLRDAIEDFAASSVPSIAEAGRNGLWLADGTGSEYTYVFDFDTRAWRYREKVVALYYDAFTGNMLGAPIGGGDFDDIYTLEPFPFDSAGVAQTFDAKTSEVRAGPGVKGVLRKVYVEADSATETLSVNAIIDGSSVALGTLSVSAGRLVNEFNVNRAGERFAIQVTGTSINLAVVIYGIEMDIYAPSSAQADVSA